MAKMKRICAVSGCNKPHKAQGLCAEHYDKQRKRGDALAAPKRHLIRDIFERFEANSQQMANGCIEWTAALTENGYGRACYRGEATAAHRLAYHIYKKPIPAFSSKSVVRHSCDNRKCVNPDHLIYGTQADNIADMIDRQRGLVGELNNSAKLDAEKVRGMRAMRRDGAELLAIASKYGVSKTTCWAVVNNRTWTHV